MLHTPAAPRATNPRFLITLDTVNVKTPVLFPHLFITSWLNICPMGPAGSCNMWCTHVRFQRPEPLIPAPGPTLTNCFFLFPRSTGTDVLWPHTFIPPGVAGAQHGAPVHIVMWFRLYQDSKIPLRFSEWARLTYILYNDIDVSFQTWLRVFSLCAWQALGFDEWAC